MAVYAITIGGVSRTIQPGWRIAETGNGRNTFACRILSLNGSYRPAIDDEVILTEDGTRIFGGLVDRPAEAGFGGTGATAALDLSISAVDFNIYAQRIRLTVEIPAGTLRAALTVVATALTAQGVTLSGTAFDGTLADGPTLPALSYSDRAINEVLDELSTLSGGYLHEIDYSKVLRAWSPGTRTAPVNITDGDGHVDGDIHVEQARSGDYANYLILLGGSGQRDVNDTVGTANGILVTFALNYTLASGYGYVNVGGSVVGGVIVGGTNETLGAGATWTYDPATGSITRSAPPAAGAIIIPYVAQFPVRVVADGGASAANRVMKTYTEPDVFDPVVLQALADSYVVRDMTAPKTVRYNAAYTLTGLHPGQTQTIASTKRNLSGSHLITDVQIVHVNGALVQRQVTAVSTTRLPATLRQTFRQVFGGGGNSGSSAGGAVPIITGSAGVGGVGTAGTLPKWVTPSTLGNSIISESGTTATVAGTVAATTFSGSGASLTSLPAANLSGTIASAVQDAITRLGTLVSGATGAGFTLALATSTISGNLPWTNLPSGSGTWTGAPTITGTVSFTAHANPVTNYLSNLGSIALKYLTIHAAELHVETLVAQDVMATIGGRILVAPTNVLAVDALAGTETTLTFKLNNFANGDRIYMESAGSVEFMAVTSGPVANGSFWDYTVTRNLDGSGPNGWYAGGAAVNLGQTGNGFIDLYSTRGVKAGTEVGPTIVGNVRLSATYNDWAPRWAIGNLDGLYGYSGTTYGAAFGVPTAAWIKIDPTNGIRIGHNATTKIALTAAGDASFSGSITAAAGAIGGWSIAAGELASSDGHVLIRSGAAGSAFIAVFDGGTNYAGLISGAASGDIAIFAGGGTASSSPFRVTHAGALYASSATITGSVTATSGAIGGFTIGSDYLRDAADSFGLASTVTGGDDVRFWAGDTFANRATADFRLYESGALVATSATISGEFSAAGGTVTIDNDGITIQAGSGSANHITWSSGGYLWGNSSETGIHAPTVVVLDTTGAAVGLTSGEFWPATALSLGKSTQPWGNAYIDGATVRLGAFAGGGNRFLKVDNDGLVFAA